MTRWQPLPDTMAADARRLALQLRRMKDRSGLTTPALAARSAHSTQSWARYLNGVQLPPRDAVEALGQLSGADYEKLGALWELAEAGGGRGLPDPDPLDPLTAEQGLSAGRAAWRLRRRPRLPVSLGLLVVVAAVVLLVALGDTAGGPGQVAAPGGGASRSASGAPGVPDRPGASAGAGSRGARTGAGPAEEPDGGTGAPGAPISDTATVAEPGGGRGAAGTVPPGTIAAPVPTATTPTATAPSPTPAPTPSSTVPSSPSSPGPTASPSGRPCPGLVILGLCIGALRVGAR